MLQKFTTKYLENIKQPGRGQHICFDEIPPLSAVSGQLGLKVGKNAKTFFMQYRMDGNLVFISYVFALIVFTTLSLNRYLKKPYAACSQSI